MDITFKRITTRVRPTRNVVFINSQDKGWQQSTFRIVEIFSNSWGGNGNIIIPTDGNCIKPEFWSILELYKPDYCYLFVKNYRHIKNGDPAIYDEERKKIKDKLMNDNPAVLESDFDMLLDRKFNSTQPYEPFQLSSQLSSEILRRLNPFHTALKVVELIRMDTLRVSSEVFLGEVLRELDDDERVLVDYDLSEMPISFQLLARCYVGSSKTFLEKYSFPRNSRSAHLRPTYPKLDFKKRKISINEESVIIDELFNPTNISHQTPFGRAGYGLARYSYSIKSQSTIVVVGDSEEDYLLFYSMNKIADGVFWIPEFYSKDVEGRWEFFHSLGYAIEANLSMAYTDDPELIFTSFSISQPNIQLLIEEIEKSSTFHFLGENSQISIREPAKAIEMINSYYYAEQNNAQITTVQQFVDNVSSNILNTPKPSIFKDLQTSVHNWITDLEIDNSSLSNANNDTGFILPSVPGLLEGLFENNNLAKNEITESLRNIGPTFSFICPFSRMFFSNQSIDQYIPKPLLRLQDSFSIFKKIFELQGHNVEMSDKGKYMEASIQLFGSLKALALELSNKEAVGALNCFIDQSKPAIRAENNIPGVILNDTVYLSYADFLRFFKKENFGEKMDEFLNKKILSRGYILQCKKCRRAEWYRFSELSEEFTCSRCLHKQIFDSKSWKKEVEPTIYYKLEEMFFQGYKNNMHITVLALYCQQMDAERSFLYSSELKITNKSNPQDTFEFDILCIRDGTLIIGEAKSSDSNFGKSEKKQILNYNKIINVANGVFLFACSSVKAQHQKVINDLSWNNAPIFQSIEDL
ncbi:MAG: hypothetical protein M3O71_03935 [Bacteroidota bacterium]|nr:hypothetical protein [Bacteroidota bacterium]